jgi:serine protein kinase
MEEYLKVLKSDKDASLGPADRLLKAIGKPKLIKTSSDRRLLRLFGNTTIRQYAPFEKIFGIERTVEKVVDFLKHASQGLEESRQVLYLRGPVGSAKSTVVEILKKLMQEEPIYVLGVLKEDGSVQTSPINESPLGLFSKEDAKALKVPEFRLHEKISPWARKRLDEFDGDISKFVVLKTYPDTSREIAIAKVEPGDENNNDISTLVGKTNIRKLSKFDQMDPDSYSYSGGLCKANQGCLDYVELNKSPIQMLNPLLTATQEGNYNPTEGIGAIPFEGIIFGHSNDTEWQKFKNDKRNEAFLDRFFVIDVAYNLRADEEVAISKVFLSRSNLSNAKIAPHTLELLGQFVVMSRLDSGEGSPLETKMRVYNGEPMKEKDPKAKSFEEYQKVRPEDEGFVGISTRNSFKILADVFDQDSTEVAADPVNLFKGLSNFIEGVSGDDKLKLSMIKEVLMSNYKDLVTDDIQTAYLDTGDDFCQSEFERYIMYSQAWLDRLDYRDPETNELVTVDQIEQELAKIEEPLGTVNVTDFRYEATNFAMSVQLKTGEMPRWNQFEKLAKVIREKMRVNMESMLPVITFNTKKTSDQGSRHNEFVKRMMEQGYTREQVQRVVEWQRLYKNS